MLLKEKNCLLTEYYDCESRHVAMPHPERLHKVKLSMKRLKGVLEERKIEYEKLNSEQQVLESRIPDTPKVERYGSFMDTFVLKKELIVEKRVLEDDCVVG